MVGLLYLIFVVDAPHLMRILMHRDEDQRPFVEDAMRCDDLQGHIGGRRHADWFGLVQGEVGA